MSIYHGNPELIQKTLNSVLNKITDGKRPEGDIPSLSEFLRAQSRTYWPIKGVESAIFKARFPDAESILKSARLTIEGRIIFQHPWHMEMTFAPENIGRDINWDNVPNGDDEWRHSLLRFFHILDLAAAYQMEKDSRFLDTISAHLFSFAASRDELLRMNRTNRLDSAIRLLSLIKSIDLIKSSSSLPDKLAVLFYGLIFREADFLADGLGQKVGNWEFFIVTSLLVAAEYLAENFETGRWRERGKLRLREIIGSEILPDGMLIEKCPMYHGEVILVLLDYLIICNSNKLPIDPSYMALVDRMTEILVMLADPQRNIPQIGDSDAFDIEYILALRQTVLGDHQADRFSNSALEEKYQINGSLFLLPSTGWAVRRWETSDGKQGYLLFDAASRPPERRYWHSHADDLQFLLTTSDGPLLADPGRFTYTSFFRNPLPFFGGNRRFKGLKKEFYHLIYPRFRELNEQNWRKYFRGSLAHNTVSCDSTNLGGYDDWRSEPPKISLLENLSYGPLMFLTGELTDFEQSSQKTRYHHRRHIIGFFPYLIAILDLIDSPRSHKWISSYHLGENIKATIDRNGVVATAASGKNYRLQFSSPSGAPFELKLDNDWVSLFYNRKIPSQTARVNIINKKHFDLFTVIKLEPFSSDDYQAEISFEDVSIEHAAGQFSFAMKLIEKESFVFIGLNNTGEVRTLGPIATDARLSLKYEKDKSGPQVGFLEGKNFSFQGKDYYSGEKPRSVFPLPI